ncbi:hypothetical protein VPHD480_0304 [Vibrio phage D480]|nr:hypothetical protein MYOV011v1_p0321 [Vibrio phage 6E35.1a]
MKKLTCDVMLRRGVDLHDGDTIANVDDDDWSVAFWGQCCQTIISGQNVCPAWVIRNFAWRDYSMNKPTEGSNYPVEYRVAGGGIGFTTSNHLAQTKLIKEWRPCMKSLQVDTVTPKSVEELLEELGEMPSTTAEQVVDESLPANGTQSLHEENGMTDAELDEALDVITEFATEPDDLPRLDMSKVATVIYMGKPHAIIGDDPFDFEYMYLIGDNQIAVRVPKTQVATQTEFDEAARFELEHKQMWTTQDYVHLIRSVREV